MNRLRTISLGYWCLLITTSAACASSPAASPPPNEPAPNARQQQGGGGPPRPGQRSGQASEPKPYDEVITDKAVTRRGMFVTHTIDDKLYFEIPETAYGKEMLLIARRV